MYHCWAVGVIKYTLLFELCDEICIFFFNCCVEQGMLYAAKAVLHDAASVVNDALTSHADYSLVLCGHSLGGGAALLATILLASGMQSLPIALNDAQRRRLRCYAYGAPPVFGPLSELVLCMKLLFVRVCFFYLC